MRDDRQRQSSPERAPAPAPPDAAGSVAPLAVPGGGAPAQAVAPADDERARVAAAPEPPGTRGYPLVGVLPRIWRDPLRFFEDVRREQGDVARVGIGRFTLYVVSHPEPLQRVLQENEANYWKGAGLEIVRPVMGDGLASSDGELWRRQRRLMQPAFARRRLSELLPPLVEAELQPLLGAWREQARRGAPVEVAEPLSALTQRVIARSLFGADLDADAAAISRALLVANEQVSRLAWSLLPLPGWVPTPRRARFRRATQLLDRTIYGLIERRRASGEERPDLLGRLLAARDEASGEGMAPRQVRDELMTLFVAGHDTTAAGLAWTLHLLAEHPGEAEAAHAEVHAALGEPATAGAGGALAASLDSLGAVDRVVQESLRLRPPGWIFVRTPHEDDVVGGYRIPAGAPVLISPWVVHRHPDVWDAPERFDPARFLPAAAAARSSFAYLPFGGGRRVCIGKAFARLVLVHVVARVLQDFELAPLPGRAPRLQAIVTLRPRDGVWLRLRPRA